MELSDHLRFIIYLSNTPSSRALILPYNFETQNGDYLETFDSVKCAILKSHY